MKRLLELYNTRESLYGEIANIKRERSRYPYDSPIGQLARRAVSGILADIENVELEILAEQLAREKSEGKRRIWGAAARKARILADPTEHWMTRNGAIVSPFLDMPKRNYGRMKLSGTAAIREELRYEGAYARPSRALWDAFGQPGRHY